MNGFLPCPLGHRVPLVFRVTGWPEGLGATEVHGGADLPQSGAMFSLSDLQGINTN